MLKRSKMTLVFDITVTNSQYAHKLASRIQEQGFITADYLDNNIYKIRDAVQ